MSASGHVVVAVEGELMKTGLETVMRNDQPFLKFSHKRIVYLDDRKRRSNDAPGPFRCLLEQNLCDEIDEEVVLCNLQSISTF